MVKPAALQSEVSEVCGWCPAWQKVLLNIDLAGQCDFQSRWELNVVLTGPIMSLVEHQVDIMPQDAPVIKGS